MRLIVPLAIVLTFSGLSFVQAQDQRRENRRAFVEDLLKGLIESQTQPRPPNPRPNAQPNVPVQPFPRQPGQPGHPPVRVDVSREMLAARGHLKNWNKASGNLVQELRHHEYEAPQLRPLMADALKLHANIELISRKAQLYPTVTPLVDDFGLIDRDWRVLSHRLQQTAGLPPECSGIINTIGGYDTQLCSLFNVQPQIDRRELTRLSTKLRSDYDHLLQDVYYLVRGKQGGRELLTRGKNLQTMIAQFSALMGRSDYNTIVGSYQQCTNNWKAMSRELIRLRDDRLRHSIADIETTTNLINEQLWLPSSLDRQYLASMAGSVAQDTTRILDTITLSQLLATKQPVIVFNSAREVQAACANFSNGVSSGAPVEDLEWDFRLFEVQWDQMHHLFHEFDIPAVNNQLEEIQFSMDTLKQTFGDAPVMPPAMMAQLTANLDALCRQTSLDVHRRIVVGSRYDQGFHDSICDSADQLSRSASTLHHRVLRNPNASLSRQDFNDMFVQWRTLKPMMNQCQEPDKLAFNQYRKQIEPLMVKLQVVFTE